MPRYVIYGAGGVGSLIGGQLSLAGKDVLLIARGAHGHALSRDGLRLKTPNGEHVLRLPVVGEPKDLDLRADDTVVLATKTQDAAGALGLLALAAPNGISVVCAQNGLESERIALRLFEHVYGAFVFVFAAVTEAGVVCSYSQSCPGILNLGRFPSGQDQRSSRLADDLRESGFRSDSPMDIMAWKRGKLLINLTNPLQAACGTTDGLEDILGGAKAEAVNCFNAAGLNYVSGEDVLKHGMETVAPGKVNGRPFPGGSTAQDLARGAAATEVDYLNGEIALLGRMLGIETPINSLLQRLMREMIRDRAKPGSIPASDLRRRIENACSLEKRNALPMS